ncbi:MAG: hypothetical protein JO101_05825, partial [Candidatus Eremiobacteraeota bacterium]|nr:hypothetical protein [Candidatus Eremiobacteraeota bacterium]
ATSVRPAWAIPAFAHQYDVTCQKCHSVVPHPNAFGAGFMASGYRIPGIQPGAAFPISSKVNLVASSANQGSGENGAGLPKAIVDEIELFTSGALGSHGSYFVEQYVLDGAMPGLVRDAWIAERVNPWSARIPVYVQAGSFTLPLPVDPETFRETYQHYAVYDQTVGANPFAFFDPKIGVRAGVGNPLRGSSLQVFAGPGHDRQSGLASIGTDLMGYAQHAAGALAASLYRYEGTRPVAAGVLDRFQRTGYGLTWNGRSRWSTENVLQTGRDSNCGLGGFGCASSGGFTQLRYSFSDRLFAESRYEGTHDAVGGVARDGVFLVGYGPTENSRLTLEDVIQRAPETKHTVNLQFTFSY